MSKIKATTGVICPVGTTIELYTDHKPAIGEVFDIRHVDTNKVVQRARVTEYSDAQWGTRKKHYRVFARITE